MKKKYIYITLIKIFSTAFILASCSSAPKRATEVFAVRNGSADQVDLGNKAVMQANYDTAITYFKEAVRLATLADDSACRVHAKLALGNGYQAQGKTKEASDTWNSALADAQLSGSNYLISAANIFIARGQLSSGKDAQKVKETIEQYKGGVSQNELYTATAWQTLGLAEKELGSYSSAENDIQNALSIHAKGLYLEDAGYDWYLIGSIRSKAESYDSALDAMQKSLEYNHRAENGAGAARTWEGIGMIYRKKGDTTQAKTAWLRAEEIYRAAFLATEADTMHTLVISVK